VGLGFLPCLKYSGKLPLGLESVQCSLVAGMDAPGWKSGIPWVETPGFAWEEGVEIFWEGREGIFLGVFVLSGFFDQICS
jgi:hypothetical protein